MDATESGRGLEPTPLDEGRCCHDKVPLLESVVALRDGLGVEVFSLIGGGGRGRMKSSPEAAARSDFGEVESERPIVRGRRGGGVRATGGSIPCVGFRALSSTSRNDGVGPVFEGDRDRARSAYDQHLHDIW